MSDTHRSDEIAMEKQYFQREFPLTFTLWDMEEQPLLSCMGLTGQTLLLRLGNVGDSEIELDEKADAANTNYFTLRFRRGTLFMPEVIQLTGVGSEWQLAHIRGSQVDELHLRPPVDFRLPPGQTYDLFLQHVRSIRKGGTRNSRVSLAYDHLKNAWGPLSGHRQTVISIVEQYPPESRGEAGARHRPLPLRVGFAGSNTVLTSTSPDADGRASQLLLQISNLSDQLLPFRRFPGNDDRSSRLVLAFEIQDEGEQRAWALGTPSQVAAIEPFLDDWEAIRFPDAEKVIWVFTPQLPEITLEPEQALALAIDNIRTDLPAGPTNLYVTLENIPDPQGGYYADQTHILTVQKSPMVQNSKTVGLGTSLPNGLLDLAGEDGSRLRFGVWVGDDDKTDQHINRVNIVSANQPIEFENPSGSFHLAEANLDSQGLRVKGPVYDRGGLVMPVGAILPFAGTVEPEGWLFCNGQIVDKSKYQDLFNVIQYIYGGSGDSFNVPNLCQRAPMGLAAGSGYFDYLGKAGGSPQITLSIDQMPVHNHGVYEPPHFHNINSNNSGGVGMVDDSNSGAGHQSTAQTQTARTNISILNAGGGQPHENLPPYLTVNFIIKY